MTNNEAPQAVVLSDFTFNFKNKALKVVSKQKDTNAFFNATAVFKTLDLPASQEPDKWLRLGDTKKFMVVNSNKVSPFKRDEELQTAFYDKRMTRLPKGIEDDFCFQLKGRSGGTYMRKELFLKYMSYLDKKLEFEIIQNFIKYGFLDKLEPNQKAEAALDIAQEAVSDAIAANTGEKPTKERTLARLDGMVKQRSLKNTLCSILCSQGLFSDSVFTEDFFRKVYVGIYTNCFGQTKEGMMELVERKSGLIRDHMSDDALDLLNAAETLIQVQLSYAKRANKNISWDVVSEIIIESCKTAAQLPFKYTDQIPFLAREPSRVFKKEINVQLSYDKSITKMVKYMSSEKN